MATGTFEFRNDAERRAIEQAIAFVTEMNDLALGAAAGQVLDQCEQQTLERGRELLRGTLEQAVQGRIAAAEVKKGRRGSARAGARSARSGGATGK